LFQHHFSLSNVHNFFSKLEKILTLINFKLKKIKVVEIHFYNIFEQIWFKCVFGLENYEIWGCGFNKNYSFLCGKKYECIIYMIIGYIYIYISNTSHMSSWKWTILGSINSFYCVFTQGLQNVLLPCEQHGMFCITNTTSQEGFRHCFERIFKINDSIPWLVFEIYNSSMLKISPCV
jgi:hypothetical protein